MGSGSASLDAWRSLAAKALGDAVRGEVGPSPGPGVTRVAPLYERTAKDTSREDGSRFWRGTAAWTVAQRMDHPDAHAANQSALRDLEGGADALTLVLAESPFSRGFGLTLESLDKALADIELDFISVRLDAGPATADAARVLVALVEERRLTSAGLTIDLGYDPIGFSARGVPSAKDDLPKILGHAASAGLVGRAMLADGRPYHEAGSSEAQELAAVIATGVAYLRQLEGAGLSLDAARRTIAFLLAVDADMFLGLAKVRALRRLWARIEQASGLAPEPMRLHAETSWRMMTRRDPWVNVMRATVATSAAGLGGADVINVLPFTLPLGLPDDHARRLARNVQRVLLDESNLGKVEDPAAGAGGFDTLTDTLCDEAWTLFQAIEHDGGIEIALTTGSLKEKIAATAHWRENRFATMRDGIIGTSRFPSLGAPAPSVLDVAPRIEAASADALPSARDAAPYEILRDRAEALPTPPALFLATLGAPASFGPRATYASNFFAAAGIKAIVATGERDIATLVADFESSGARVACLCGSDNAYAANAVDLATSLRAAGASRLLLAGRPGADEAALKAGGIDAFIHDGCAALDVLDATLQAASQAASNE